MELLIIPKPNQEVVYDNDKSFRIDSNIIAKTSSDNPAFLELNSFLNKAFGYTIKSGDNGTINMFLDKTLKANLGNEGYILKVNENGILIKAAENNGLFYAVQTLKQIIVQFKSLNFAEIPYLEIHDKPLYSYRGYMLDVSRHFFPIEDIIKVIDTLALQKINTFHWHLTEDQGWRIQIDKYPLLTTIGARRKETLGDKVWHGGYYTKADIKKIVDYCASKFITVIPEIDLPGHSMAAAAAYNYLTCRAEPLEVSTSFGIKPDIFCAGKESTYKFLFDVLDEIIEMFPGEYIHLGGDEAPKIRWEECPHCKKAISDNNLKNTEELQGYFLNKLVNYLKKRGKKVICWNESLYSQILDKSVVCQYWSDGKVPTRVVNEMNNGRSGIISKFSPYYLDYPYAMHSLKMVYEFAPELEGLNNNANISGIEAPLWTEYVTDRSRIEYMTYPRLAAVGEIGWIYKTARCYSDFELRLMNFLKLLDIYNVKYTPFKEVNPKIGKKIKQMLKFVSLIYSKENIKSIKASAKGAKAIKAVRKEIE